jgi:zinc protease
MKTSLTMIAVLLGLVFQARAAEPAKTVPVASSASRPVSKTTAVAPKTTPATPSVSENGSQAASAITTTFAARSWPHESSDIKPDPRIVWGKLDNGLRYVILPVKSPGRASLQLYINAGSLMESDDQQGIAHFLEHLAFNGTKHFAAGQTIEYFQRLGMSFGAHTNAYTTFDRTVYKIELPRTNEEMTGEGLKLFRDFLDGMLLEKKEIDRERRVIFSEIIARNSAGDRAATAWYGFAMPDTLVPHREPLGIDRTLRAMSRDQFVAFYEKWYTPGRATVVAVGSFDTKMVERLVRENFAGAKARRGEQPDPSFGKVKPTRGLTANLQVDAEAQQVTISLNTVAPSAKAADTVERRRSEIVKQLAIAMLNARFGKITSERNAPIQAAGGSIDHELNLADINSVRAVCQPAQWKAALAAIEQELRRAVAYGFSGAEFNQAKASFGSLLKSLVAQSETQEASGIAAAMIDSLSKSEVVDSPTDTLAVLTEILAGLKKSECETALRNTWRSEDVQILVQGNVPLAAGEVEPILAAYRKSRGTFVSPPSEEKTARFAYTNFGPAGRIVKREEDKDLGIVEATFANNVHINVKRTDREKDAVRVLIRIGGGMLELPADKPGLMSMTDRTFIGGGLEAHSISEINQILSDKVCGIEFSVKEDAFQLRGGCSSELLELELDLCAAYLKAPGYRAEARERFMQNAESIYAGLEHTAEGVEGNDVDAFLRSDDPRFRFPSREALQKLTTDDVKNWLTRPLGKGYMEVAIVGDIDPEQALNLAAKTVGALPEREAKKPSFDNVRRLKFPSEPKTKTVSFASEQPRGKSIVCWPTLDSFSMSRQRRLSILSEVLSDRLRVKVRQELGATYTPEVTSEASPTFDKFGYLKASLTVEPKQLPEVSRLVAKVASELAIGGVSDDEFKRAIEPTLASIDDRGNGFWAGLLGECQEHPEMLDFARGMKADFASIKRSEIEALAKAYLGEGKATIINVAPTAPAKSASSKEVEAASTNGTAGLRSSLSF